MQKLVMDLEIHDEKAKRKAMMTVSAVSGIQSIQMEQKNKKLTVIGEIDPVRVVMKLRKHCRTTMVSLGPAQEAKKEEPKKEQAKKPEDKKDQMVEFARQYHASHYHASHPYWTTHYYNPSAEENPNSCVIF